MMDFLLQMGLSNAFFALALALVAMAVGARATRPQLAHLFWLLVFVKLVTPPLVTIPVGIFSPQPDQAGAGDRAFIADESSAVAETVPGSSWPSSVVPFLSRAKPYLVTLWLLGSGVVFVCSMARVFRFGRLLAAESDVTPPELHAEAERIARRLGLANTPTIRTVTAHLSPMVWWTGGHVQVVMPRALLAQMDAQDWRWILAHELAHVRRRDYLVRWVEWLACVGFWWNPVVWWAQRNLRALEEICCDDLVISSLNPRPKSYADSLFAAVQFLARPAVRAPAVASEINRGGYLERRFRMIVSSKSNRSSSRWSRRCVLVCALAVLPLGMVSAQNYEAVGKRLKMSVMNGEITQPQADAMMAALKKEATRPQSPADLTAVWEKLQAQVRAGEITKDQALEKMTAIKSEAARQGGRDKLAAKKDQAPDKVTPGLMKLKQDLGAAVEAGKISKEDAFKKYEAAKRGLQEKEATKSQGPADLNAIREKLTAQVQAGEITKDQAIEKMTAIKAAAAEKDADKAMADPKTVKKAAIKSGKEDPVKKDPKVKKAVKKDGDPDKVTSDRTEVKKDRGGAVEGGKIAKKDAARTDKVAAKGNQEKTAAQLDDDAVGQQLKAAVQAGQLTKEEARAKWQAIREKAAKDRDAN
ncbi:MAG: hypothetical protein A2Y77_00165 [Planctomycetes bacterium RBG_13_62_9]|nr:MAG: hypothetical protein A2Y77_00165 [Planctomycetes bacterium RBG_13_62_9]